MLPALRKSKLFYVVLGLYTISLLWWLKINFLTTSFEGEVYYFNWFYGLIALTGSLYTIFFVARKWGGYKSVIGKSLIFISLGLLSQWFGLQIWTYYNLILKIEVPYPSFADIGYFALIPFYTLGA